jgi:hypothetical protein
VIGSGAVTPVEFRWHFICLGWDICFVVVEVVNFLVVARALNFDVRSLGSFPGDNSRITEVKYFHSIRKMQQRHER